MHVIENKNKESSNNDDGLIELLAERTTRKIISFIQDRPVAISDIAKNCNLSANLVYRRVHELESLCMLYVSGDIGANGKKKYFYQSKIRLYSEFYKR